MAAGTARWSPPMWQVGTHPFQARPVVVRRPGHAHVEPHLGAEREQPAHVRQQGGQFANLDASVQASTDGGTTWANLYDQQNGNEGAFSHKTVSLAAYAGRQIKIASRSATWKTVSRCASAPPTRGTSTTFALVNTQEAGTSTVGATVRLVVRLHAVGRRHVRHRRGTASTRTPPTPVCSVSRSGHRPWRRRRHPPRRGVDRQLGERLRQIRTLVFGKVAANTTAISWAPTQRADQSSV